MSLELFSNVDMDPYLDGSAFTANIYPGWLLSGDIRHQFLYVDKLSLILCGSTRNGPVNGFAFIDPRLVDNTGGNVGNVDLDSIGDRAYFHLGAYDPVADEQKLYRARDNTSTNFEWEEVSLTSPDITVVSDPWPNVGTLNPRNAGPAPLTNGYYTADREWLFFPDWQGGQGFCHMQSVRAGGSAFTNVFCQVDLATGFATPVPENPAYYTTSPSIYQGPELFNRVVTFAYLQFVPDSDSRGVSPKGRIMMTSLSNNGVTSAREIHFKVVEFNPEGVVGTPNRIHWRERQLSRFIVNMSSGFLAGTNRAPATSNAQQSFKFDTRANQWLSIFSVLSPSPTRAAGHVGMMRLKETPAVDILTKPRERFGITTNRVVALRTEARGDLNEVVAGVPITMQCRRVSTKGEILPTTNQPNDVVQLANATAGVGGLTRAAAYPFEIRQDGVPLTETTDYTVDEPNGQVTLIADTTGHVYTADYTHTGNPISPAFGTLLNAAVTTDENGKATFRVQYPDDDTIAGFIDQYDVSD